MSIQIVEETRFFLYSVITGAFISLLYDVIRILRRVIAHNKTAVAFEDLLFWIVSIFILFFMLYDMSYGVLRWFSIAGATIGMTIYKKILGEHLVSFLSTILRWVLDVVISFISVLFRPLLKAKKKLTDKLKLVKIAVYKFAKKSNKAVENQNES